MTSKRIVRAAAVQISPEFGPSDGTVAKVCQAIADAAARGAQLAVFPETFVPYYPYFSFVLPPVAAGREHLKLYERAPTVPGPAVDAVAAQAKAHGVVVVLGVNERDHGSLYNTQLIFDETGRLALKRRKITPTYHERMIWGQGDAAGLKVVDTGIGRIGALACWEHYNPLARYALMAQHEEIHCSQFPGSLVGPIFAEQMEVTIRHHALESGCFVVNATGWLSEEQIASVSTDPALQKSAGRLLHGDRLAGRPALGGAVAGGRRHRRRDLDMSLITKRKRMMDSVGHYARPELLSLRINRQAAAPLFSDPPGADAAALFSQPIPEGERMNRPMPAEFPTAGLVAELQSLGLRLEGE
uniref:nitrilase-related carbon-nitrogen hydrolase n=1 Tax=Methylogaea oryzae TaxID=1295382 RepID=UPI000B241DB2